MIKKYLITLCLFLTNCESENDYSLDKPKIFLDYEAIELNVGESKRLLAYFEPAETQNIAHTWSSNNEDVASVDETGLVRAKSEGTATITAKTAAGSSKAKCSVTVIGKASEGNTGNNDGDKNEAPTSLTPGGGLEIKKAPFQLGFLKAQSSSTGLWYTNKDYGWTCTAIYRYSRTDKTTANFSSTATQSITGRVWTISATLHFDDAESGTASYRAYAPSGDSESGTTEFRIYDYYPTRE